MFRSNVAPVLYVMSPVVLSVVALCFLSVAGWWLVPANVASSSMPMLAGDGTRITAAYIMIEASIFSIALCVATAFAVRFRQHRHSMRNALSGIGVCYLLLSLYMTLRMELTRELGGLWFTIVPALCLLAAIHIAAGWPPSITGRVRSHSRRATGAGNEALESIPARSCRDVLLPICREPKGGHAGLVTGHDHKEGGSVQSDIRFEAVREPSELVSIFDNHTDAPAELGGVPLVGLPEDTATALQTILNRTCSIKALD